MNNLGKGTAAGFQASGQPKASAETSDTIDFTSIMRALSRRKWYILAWIMVVAGIAVVYALMLATPKYTAKASVLMLNRGENILGLETVLSEFGGEDKDILTEGEVMKSRQLMGAIIDALDLGADPEFNSELRAVPLISPGQVRAWLTGETPGPMTERELRSTLIDTLLDTIQVRNLVGTYVFDVVVTTEDPVKSARIANTLSELYIGGQIQRKLAATELATEWLTGRAGELREQLEAAENRLASFISATELVSPQDLNLQNVQLKEFRVRLLKLREDERLLIQQAEAAAQARATGDTETIVILFDDVALERLADRVAAGAAGARQAFDTRTAELVNRAGVELARVRNQAAAIAQSVMDLDRTVASLSRDLLTLQQLEREAQAARLIYEHFLTRLQETAVQAGLQQADSEVLSPAEVPLETSAPRKRLIVAVAIILGFLIGATLVLLREARARGLRSSQDAEEALGLPVIGQLPRAPWRRRQKLLRYVIDKPASGLMESVRNLRTSIQLSFIDKPPQVMMITSALPDEGKSSSTMLLAHAFAQSGQRTLVIECDVRRRALKEFFNRRAASAKQGIFAVASGKATLADTVVANTDFGFDTLLSEKIAVNASEFFLSEKFTKLMETARAAYDTVLLDVPPVLMVTDARIIGRHVDATLFAFKWDSTHRDSVLAGVDSLRRFNLDITGLVMTQIDSKKLRSYGEVGGYGDYYASSSKYYRN